MKKVLLMLLAVLAMAACNSNAPKQAKQVNIDELILSLEQLEGQEVEFAGKAVYDTIYGGIAVYGADTVAYVYVAGGEDVAMCPTLCGKQVVVTGKVAKCEQGKLHVKASDVTVGGQSCRKEGKCGKKDGQGCPKADGKCCKKDGQGCPKADGKCCKKDGEGCPKAEGKCCKKDGQGCPKADGKCCKKDTEGCPKADGKCAQKNSEGCTKGETKPCAKQTESCTKTESKPCDKK